MKIILLPVKTTSEKLAKIVQTATDHFHQKEPLQFFVQDQAAWEFLDKLLWSHPPESFLPHPSKLIQTHYQLDSTITTVFNLSSAPLFHDTIRTVYELEDHSSPEKLKASQDRYHAYREKDLQIIVSPSSDGRHVS